VASFTASTTDADVDEVIWFTNQSTEATSYQWEFGDGTTSTQENPTHAYSTEGIFNVELTAKNDAGSSSASTTISVAYPDPVADFSMDKTTADMDETITFTNLSQNASSYAWSFGDGATSTEANPTHSYAEAGTYTVQLTATGPGGASNSTTRSVTIEWPEPVASFTTDKPGNFAAPGVLIHFTNTSEYATSYLWDFGDGATSTVTSPTHSYTAEGIYTVQLTATGEGGSHSVSDAFSIYVTPVAAFTMDRSSANVGETITFTNESEHATTYLWDFGDGSTSTTEDPVHDWATGGVFSVQLTATGPGGSDDVSHEVTIVEVNIFPGVGIMDIELIETWATIEDKMGEDVDYLGYYIDNEGYVSHVWESESLGIILFLVSPTASYNPSDEDILWLIGMYDNYVGMTEEGIMMGSLLSDVEAAYGEPDRIDEEYDSWFYDYLGIRFYFNDSLIIDQMTVFLGDVKKSTGISQPTIGDLDLRNIKLQLRK
jgi:PKD repeat protein